jgi:hypothetical protein
MQRKWQPKVIRAFVDSIPSSTNVAIVETDAGRGYLKAMGNPEGEHALACEWVGTQLADWFGLRTFDFALIAVDANEIEISFKDNSLARSGPAFITRAENGEKWSGSERELVHLANPEDVTRLVVFDTWIQNRDRHRSGHAKVDNVFLSTDGPPGRLTLIVSDHTHCFGAHGQISRRVANIHNRQDPQTYGLFPAFRHYLDRKVGKRAAQRLATFTSQTAERFVRSIPREWDVSPGARRALAELLVARADYTAQNILRRLWPQKELDFMSQTEDES